MLKLNISSDVGKKLDEELILEEDLATAIMTCRENGRYLIDQETGWHVCHLQIGYVTYWVCYSEELDGSLTIHKAYSHRMSIKSEYRQEN